MGMRLKIKHPMLRTELTVVQHDHDPNEWELYANGRTPISFRAEGADDAMSKAQSLCGNLQLTEEAKAKREARSAAMKAAGRKPGKKKDGNGGQK